MSTRTPVRALILCSLALVCPFAQQTQGPLTNQRIGQLVEAGVTQNEIIRIISSATKVNFDLRPNSTDELLKIGVSEDILKAMAAKENGASPMLQPVSSRKRLSEQTAGTSVTSTKLRVFVDTSNDSWSFTAGRRWGQGSTHPQTVELMKTFGQSCPGLTVTNDREKADYVVSFERESNKSIRRHNKFAAFNRDGDMVFSSSTRELGNAVRGFCASIR